MSNLYTIYTDDRKISNAMHNCIGEKTQTEFDVWGGDFHIRQWFENDRGNTDSVILNRSEAEVLVAALQEWLNNESD